MITFGLSTESEQLPLTQSSAWLVLLILGPMLHMGGKLCWTFTGALAFFWRPHHHLILLSDSSAGWAAPARRLHAKVKLEAIIQIVWLRIELKPPTSLVANMNQLVSHLRFLILTTIKHQLWHHPGPNDDALFGDLLLAACPSNKKPAKNIEIK